jgi:hypothetical protein
MCWCSDDIRGFDLNAEIVIDGRKGMEQRGAQRDNLSSIYIYIYSALFPPGTGWGGVLDGSFNPGRLGQGKRKRKGQRKGITTMGEFSVTIFGQF